MMKRLTAGFLALALALTLASCGSRGPGGGDTAGDGGSPDGPQVTQGQNVDTVFAVPRGDAR